MSITLSKDIREAINDCLADQATAIVAQVRPLLVSYASVIHRCPRVKDLIVKEGTRSYDALTASIIETYEPSWHVTKIPDWGYCFNPKETI
jgi:hypothetical protein